MPRDDMLMIGRVFSIGHFTTTVAPTRIPVERGARDGRYRQMFPFRNPRQPGSGSLSKRNIGFQRNIFH